MSKYVFKPYSENFPHLFEVEKKRLLTGINCPAEIEHVGSTAIPGLGGKGIIDIAIAVPKQNLETVSKQLQSLGYEFRPNFSTSERLYFVIFLPDPEEETRRYHIHLTYPESKEWKELIEFRDYLRQNPDEAKEYAEVKKQAAIEANQDGKKYRQLKEHIFQKAKTRILLKPKRIMIFGIPGSGKSTFAVELSQRLGLPLFHLDKYFFVQGWQERDYNEFLSIQRELVEKEHWIIDGNATRSFEMRFSRSDVVLYFRFNRLLCLWRIFKRLIRKNPHISDRAEGCSENVRLRLIRYLWGFDKRVRKSIATLREKYPSAQFHELHDDKEVKEWIEKVSPSPYSPEIKFQPLQRHHLPLLMKWLNEPHVWKWWGENKSWTASAVEIKYTSYLQQYKLDDGTKKPIYPFIVFYQDKPIGYIQYYNAFDFQREGFEVQDVWKELPNSLAALDFYIGEPSYLGKGIGSRVLSSFLETHVYTQFSACLVDPEKDNLRAVKTYEKVGFKRLCEQGDSLVMIAKPAHQRVHL